MHDPTPTHLAQVAIKVEDVERAKAFYRDVLGLPHLFDAPPGLSFFQCGETRLMLSRPEEGTPAGSSVLYYAVPDVSEAQRVLAAKGVRFKEDAKVIARLGETEVWLAIFHDGEGNMLGLMSERQAS